MFWALLLDFSCILVLKGSRTKMSWKYNIFVSQSLSLLLTFYLPLFTWFWCWFVWSCFVFLYLHAAVDGTDWRDLVSAVSPDAPTQATDHRPLILTVEAERIVVLRARFWQWYPWNTHILSGPKHQYENLKKIYNDNMNLKYLTFKHKVNHVMAFE